MILIHTNTIDFDFYPWNNFIYTPVNSKKIYKSRSYDLLNHVTSILFYLNQTAIV